MRNGNGSYGTEEQQRYNRTSQRHNGMAKRRRQNGNGMVETRHKQSSVVGLGLYTSCSELGTLQSPPTAATRGTAVALRKAQ